VPGIISLIFGILALVLLVFGCLFSCLGGFILYPVAALIAVIGLVLGFFARDGLRVAGITVNALALLPAVILIVMWVIGMAASVAGGI
jgi:hypothetical protein